MLLQKCPRYSYSWSNASRWLDTFKQLAKSKESEVALSSELSPKSLAIKLCDGLKYLCENYSEHQSVIDIPLADLIELKNAVRFSIRGNCVTAIRKYGAHATIFKPTSKIEWKEKVEDFLKNAPSDEVLTLTVALDLLDKQWLEGVFNGIQSMYRIEGNNLVIVK